MSHVDELENEIEALRKELEQKEHLLEFLKNPVKGSEKTDLSNQKLTNEEIIRYSRQIILPEIGVKGQLALKNASVLVVGAGGLGCPAALYLCGAGIGHIGIVDYDLVEINNLHRQLLHTEQSLGIPKSISVKNQLMQLNSSLIVSVHHDQLNSENALKIIDNYDIVLDCTDNVATRYLLNDASVMLKKPLVSGSALQLEGQLTIYNYNDGPCYRCIFPKPPPPETVTNCGDGGVIGAVTGVIGTLQALETIKIILKMSDSLSGRLLLFDASKTVFRNVRLRGKKTDCEICSEQPIITKLIDYEQFCGMRATDKDIKLEILSADKRISVNELQQVRNSDEPHLLIDVRSEHEFDICQLKNSENFPIKMFINRNTHERGLIDRIKNEKIPVYVICRRGNDSQIAAQQLIEDLKGCDVEIKDIIGGLHAWSSTIDSNFPVY